MKKFYQKPELEYVMLGMVENITTTTDDTELGVESNPWLLAVQEDEQAENE